MENWHTILECRIDAATENLDSDDPKTESWADQIAAEVAAAYAGERGCVDGSDRYEAVMSHAMDYIGRRFPSHDADKAV